MNIEAFEKELKKLFEKKYPKEKLDLIEDWFFVGYVSFYRDKRLKIEDKISNKCIISCESYTWSDLFNESIIKLEAIWLNGEKNRK